MIKKIIFLTFLTLISSTAFSRAQAPNFNVKMLCQIFPASLEINLESGKFIFDSARLYMMEVKEFKVDTKESDFSIPLIRVKYVNRVSNSVEWMEFDFKNLTYQDSDTGLIRCEKQATLE